MTEAFDPEKSPGMTDLMVSPEDIAAIDLKPKFEHFPLSEFHLKKILWAANRFVLWPAGLALTVAIDSDEYTSWGISEWKYSDGHNEAIDCPDTNAEDQAIFTEWLRERVSNMPKVDQDIAVAAFTLLGISL
jgi:hypothetical protein